jgi:hypothetical protein
VTVTSATGELVLALVGWDASDALTVDATFASDWSIEGAAGGNDRGSSGAHKAGASSVTRTDVLAGADLRWAAIGVALKSAAAITEAAFSSAGVGAMSAVGRSQHAAAFSSAGVGAASFVGVTGIEGVLSSAGVGAAAFVGRSTHASVLASSGVGATSFVGQSTAAAALAAAGVGAASFVSFGGSSTPGATVWGRTDSNGYLVVTVLGSASPSQGVPFGLNLTATADGYIRSKTEGSPSSPGPLAPLGNLLVSMDGNDEEVLVIGQAETGAPASTTPLTPLGNLQVKKGADGILLCRVVGVLSGTPGPRTPIKNLQGVADENGYLCVVTES